MYLTHLHLQNLRSIGSADLRFRCPEEAKERDPLRPDNVQLLLGDNGTGKTTILIGATLAVLSRVLEGSGFRPFHLVRRGQEEEGARADCELILHDQDFATRNGHPETRVRHTLHLKLRGSQHEFDWGTDPPSPASDDPWALLDEDKGAGWLLAAYGATRRVERSEVFDASQREKSRSRRFWRVASLFEDHIGLVPLGGWWPQLEGKRRKEVRQLLNKSMPKEIALTAGQPDLDPLFETEGETVPFSVLSDGYKAYIGLVADILYQLHTACEPSWSLAALPGIVLIDEVDLHLHPSWQREVLPRLAATFPKLQFIVSSHSAIVAGTVPDKRLFVLERAEEGSVTAHLPVEPIYGRSSDQILLSRYFGLETSRAPGAVDELAKLSRQAMYGDSDAAMELLREMAGVRPGQEDESSHETLRPATAGEPAVRSPESSPRPARRRRAAGSWRQGVGAGLVAGCLFFSVGSFAVALLLGETFNLWHLAGAGLGVLIGLWLAWPKSKERVISVDSH